MTKPQTFEKSISKLQKIVEKLETGQESLENSLKLFEEGTKLADFCYKTLASAEQKIIELSQFESMKNCEAEDSNDK